MLHLSWDSVMPTIQKINKYENYSRILPAVPLGLIIVVLVYHRQPCIGKVHDMCTPIVWGHMYGTRPDRDVVQYNHILHLSCNNPAF